MAKFFINRPIVAMVISILMVIIGVVCLLGLPAAQYPDIVPPEIQVKAMYPGADALTVENSVATPIEQQMAGVDNMNYMYSVNANNGTMTLTVNFDLATDVNTDQILTQMRQSQAASQLPQSVTAQGVTVQKSLSSPLLLFALSSPNETYDNIFLANYANINLNDQFTRVPGVASVSVFGAGQYAMRLWVKPDRLAKLGITIPEIIGAIQAQNTVNPSGTIGGEPAPAGQEFTYAVRAQGRLSSEEEFGNIVLRADSDTGVVRIKDVGRIELGAQTYSLEGRFNGKPAAVLALYQLPGSNALAAAEGAKALMEELSKSFPPDLTYEVALDTTLPVTEGIKEIQHTLIEAIILVLLVVFLFLQGWRATLIPLLAVPVSLVATFALFPVLGFSINTISLFGLVLAIGLVVDDAIVVVEAVEHHIEKGLSPKAAALQAMKEVSGPVMAIAIILAAVFVPTAFIPGITGRLYQQFALTIAISVVISAFNALTLSPALSALLLRPKKESNGPLAIFFRWFNKVFNKATNGYVGVCHFLIRKSFVTVLLLVGAVLLTGLLGKKLPSGFLPEEDQGYLFAMVQLPNASSLQRTSAVAKEIETRLADVPGIQSTTTVVGINMLSSVQNTYSGFFFITLKNWSERTAPEEKYHAIMANVQRELSKSPEAVAFAFSPPAIPGVGTAGGITFLLQDKGGNDMNFLSENTQKFLAAVRQRPEIASATTTLLASVPQVEVDVDRDKVLLQGVQLQDVYQTLQCFMGGAFVNYFNLFGRQWQVYVQAEGEYRTDAHQLGQFYVRNKANEMVPLAAVTSVRDTQGPEFTMRHNLRRSAQLNINAAEGYSSSQAMAALEEVCAKEMPSDIGFAYMGMSFQEKQAAEGISPMYIFGLSLLCVFLILAALYESWSMPFSVLVTVPIAVMGAFLALAVGRMENNIYAQIGLVMLIGLAAKNAILIVEFAKMSYDDGAELLDAALEGARLRLRPILMTSLAFILGCMPLATASGAGAMSRQVMGFAVIGGMLLASFFAIFLIPASYYIVAKLARVKRMPREGESVPANELPAA